MMVRAPTPSVGKWREDCLVLLHRSQRELAAALYISYQRVNERGVAHSMMTAYPIAQYGKCLYYRGLI